ncbi:hypothetical protein [Actinoplanes sp. TFC3]|uniref:hypothetical protein n=1 Tax=Actinoplanes sp. TFC3 TaxID=1710355 RepID=UPI00128FD211|nr:hypothetical protein [Actinoplanes sp. TFC3]
MTVELPLVVYLPKIGREWRPIELEHRGVAVIIYPPHKSRLEPRSLYGEEALPLSRQPFQLIAADPQPEDYHARYREGPVIATDALVVELRRDQFETDKGLENIELAFEALNVWLENLRLVTHANELLPLAHTRSGRWLAEYLDDNGSPAFPDRPPGFGAPHDLKAMNITPEVWERLRNRGKVDPGAAAAANLLMDARRISSHIGASIVLAYTAVETRIESALDALAKLHSIDDDLWEWINGRSDFRARPSTEERWDTLLKAIGGTSLKSTERLWVAFKELRRARNSFAHSGVPVIGNTVVGHEKAFELISLAAEIVGWIEDQLPTKNRKPLIEPIEGFVHTFTL